MIFSGLQFLLAYGHCLPRETLSRVSSMWEEEIRLLAKGWQKGTLALHVLIGLGAVQGGCGDGFAGPLLGPVTHPAPGTLSRVGFLVAQELQVRDLT